MKSVILERFGYTPMGTFGRLSIDGTGFRCFTVERPWQDNQHGVSCIPEGTYPLVLVSDEQTRVPTAGLSAYVVDKVPNRSGIMIHIANTMYDVEGCIGLGNEFDCVATRSLSWTWGVSNSTLTYKQFMAAMADDPVASLKVFLSDARPHVA